MESVVELTCPGCGALVSTGQKTCQYCHAPIVISTFNSVAGMSAADLNKHARSYRQGLKDHPDNKDLNKSLAMCYLKLKMYAQAAAAFAHAIEDNFDDSESFFYAALTTLQGKKAYLAGRKAVDQSEEYINAALMIEPKGIYYYFLAYLKYDFFARKHFRTTPTYEEALANAQSTGLSETDIEQLYIILGVARPSSL